MAARRRRRVADRDARHAAAGSASSTRSARRSVALKGPITTPVGEGFRSVNVTLRQALDLYANLRPARSMKGIETRYEDVDLVIVRENTEDLYAGIEHAVGKDAAESIKIITRGASERIARFAFDYAVANGRHKVTAVHKANIMKLSDGLFLESCRTVAAEYEGRHRVRGPHRRQHVHAARPEARAVRRAGAAQPLRRHRQRPVPPAWSAAWAWRPAQTSARTPPSSSRSTAPRPSTPARTWPTRRRSSCRRADAAPPRRDGRGRARRARRARSHRRGPDGCRATWVARPARRRSARQSPIRRSAPWQPSADRADATVHDAMTRLPTDRCRYRGREGMLAWAFHRISGIGIFAFVVLHVVDIYLVGGNPAAVRRGAGVLRQHARPDARGRARRGAAVPRAQRPAHHHHRPLAAR